MDTRYVSPVSVFTSCKLFPLPATTWPVCRQFQSHVKNLFLNYPVSYLSVRRSWHCVVWKSRMLHKPTLSLELPVTQQISQIKQQKPGQWQYKIDQMISNLHNGFVVLRKCKVLDDVPSNMFSLGGAWHPPGWSLKLHSLPSKAWNSSHVARPGLLFVAAATDTQGYTWALETGHKSTAEMQSHIRRPRKSERIYWISLLLKISYALRRILCYFIKIWNDCTACIASPKIARVSHRYHNIDCAYSCHIA